MLQKWLGFLRVRVMLLPDDAAFPAKVCNIKKLRANVSGEPGSLDSECQRVLGTATRPGS
jgi:hypothetical protein